MRSIPIVAIAWILVALAGCGGSGSVPVATKGQAKFVILTKEWWTERGSGGKTLIARASGYEFRSLRSGEWVVAARTTSSGFDGHRSELPPTEDRYSAEKYAVNPTSEFTVRRATEAEWHDGQLASRTGKNLFPRSGEDQAQETFEYLGHTYRRQSKFWGRVIVSPEGNWLATYSFGGSNTGGGFLGGGRQKQVGDYWDVFDVRTGEHVSSLAGTMQPSFSDDSYIFWIGEEYLVIPAFEKIGHLVIVSLPKK